MEAKVARWLVWLVWLPKVFLIFFISVFAYGLDHGEIFLGLGLVMYVLKLINACIPIA